MVRSQGERWLDFAPPPGPARFRAGGEQQIAAMGLSVGRRRQRWKERSGGSRRVFLRMSLELGKTAVARARITIPIELFEHAEELVFVGAEKVEGDEGHGLGGGGVAEMGDFGVGGLEESVTGF
jgi:hypothetical protein